MKAAFFDIDGTLVSQFTVNLYLTFLIKHRVFRKESIDLFSAATEEYKNGNRTYEQLAEVWGKVLGEGLQGLDQQNVAAVTRDFWDEVSPRVAPWAKEIIELFNDNGYATIAISGSPIELLRLYQEKLGLRQIFGSTAEVSNGVYTGKVTLNLILKNEKEMTVKEIIRDEHVAFHDAFGFGDNEHDRAFLDTVGHPIVIISESNFKEYAKDKGWPFFEFTDAEEIKNYIRAQLSSSKIANNIPFKKVTAEIK